MRPRRPCVTRLARYRQRGRTVDAIAIIFGDRLPAAETFY